MTLMYAYAKWAFWKVAYWIKPYDMLADDRRWFWQPRTPCGGVIMLPLESLGEHRRRSCCTGERKATCPWPDYCDRCGEDWPCLAIRTTKYERR